MTATGMVYCFGDNSHGKVEKKKKNKKKINANFVSLIGFSLLNDWLKLGVGADQMEVTSPILLSALDKKAVTQIACGSTHTCAIAEDILYVWGKKKKKEKTNKNNFFVWCKLK